MPGLYQCLTPELWNYVTEGLDGEDDQKQVVQEIYPPEAERRFFEQLENKRALHTAWENCVRGERAFSVDIKTLTKLNLRKVTIQEISLPRALVENLTGVFELRLSDISIIEATGRPLVLRAPYCTRLKLERTTTLLTTEFCVSGPCRVSLFKVSSPDISVNWHCRTQGSSLYIEKCGEAIGVRLKNILRQNVQNLDHLNLDILKQ
eukprot:g51806.t1